MAARLPAPASRIAVAMILIASGAGSAKSFHRTGMAEIGFRAWSLERTTLDDEAVDQVLFGASAAWFYNDNISLGFETATFGSSLASDSLVLDAVVKLYWWPLSAVTPWTSAGVGGAFGLPEGNAVRARAGLGIRWVPPVLDDALAIDLQLIGVERWRQDWAVEYVDEDQPSGRIEWSMTRSPWASGSGMLRGSSPLAWPVLGIAWRF